MRWQELTPPGFAAAVKETGGVCLLPLGVVETHAWHLPLGTDYLVVDTVAEKAAEIEPAIVFPSYYFGTFPGGMYQPGTIDFGYQLLFDLLTDVVAEISRNGLKKIILVNGHGGYNSVVWDFLASQFEQERDYVVYVFTQLYQWNDPEWQKMKETETWGHACEMETSYVLGTHPDLVHLEAHRGSGANRKQFALEGVGVTGAGLLNHPDHYVGDGRPSTRAKGEFLVTGAAQRLAKTIAAAKADTKAAEFMRQFYKAAGKP